MYLAPEHDPDILISYSHGDVDGTGQSELKAWSKRFAEALEAELRLDTEFRTISIFLDESRRSENALDRTLPLTEQLRHKVQGAGLLTIVMSPQYLASAWCKDEREWWVQHRAKRGDARGLMFVCRIWPTDSTQWPDALRDERGNSDLGFWFHSRERTAAAVRPYGWRGRTDDQNAFTSALLDLVGAISQRLRQYRRQLEATRRTEVDAQRLAAAQGQVLYLYARCEQQAQWERTYGALEESGFVIVPAAPEPRADTPERLRVITEERVNQLVASDALLLVAGEDGFSLDGDMLSIGRQSRHLARARSGKLLPCAVLAGGSPAVRSPQRLTLARKLGIDWIDEPLPVVASTVHGWLSTSTYRLDVAA